MWVTAILCFFTHSKCDHHMSLIQATAQSVHPVIVIHMHLTLQQPFTPPCHHASRCSERDVHCSVSITSPQRQNNSSSWQAGF